MKKNKGKITVIIPTYNRESDLKKCINSILSQTVIPDEVIVIDDGELKEIPLYERCTQRGINLVYIKKNKHGVVFSRNIGVEKAKGDIIFLLEDDVVLFPDYIEEILKVYQLYESQGVNIGGVGGIIANPPQKGLKKFLLWAYYVIFFNSGFKEGKILPSGFGTDYNSTPFPLKKIQEVDFLPGGVSSFKKEIFNQFQFLEKYQTETGYAQGEDRDFSYRVSQKYKIFINPKAKLNHYSSPKTNYNRKIRGRAYVLFHYLFFKDHLDEKIYQKFLFYYALFGFGLLRLIIAIISFKKSEWQRVGGIFEAVKNILSKKEIFHV